MKIQIHNTDALTLLKNLDDASVDALVTDPPSGIGFMGRDWDSHSHYKPKTHRGRDVLKVGEILGLAPWEVGFVGFMVDIVGECWRVLKPGGHGLVWALPRTADLTGLALRVARWEIRDSLHHLFGSGFPKSLNLAHELPEWDGWGTALKPAHEVWWLVRKPISGTVAANVLEWGTGGLNVDGCRVEGSTTQGRWPTNLLLTHSASCTEEDCAPDCPVLELGRQSGVSSSVKNMGRNGSDVDCSTYGLRRSEDRMRGHNDTGTAARFFPTFRYQAKPSRSEREAGCEHLTPKTGAQAVQREEGSPGLKSPRARAGRTAGEIRNHHPTVKPVELMRWLVRLITPPGGTVLDPFTGSGTTALACVHEGVNFLGSEMDADFARIARARVDYADPAGAVERRADDDDAEAPVDRDGQASLF